MAFTLREFLSDMARKAKGDDYVISSVISTTDLIEIARIRLFMLVRGMLCKSRLKVTLPFFVGPSVVFRGRRHIRIGRGVTIYKAAELYGLAEKGIVIGNGSSIGAYSILRSTLVLDELGRGIRIGTHVGIGPFSFIGGFGGVEIGDNTIIGHGLSVHSDNHRFDRSEVRIRNQGVNQDRVIVGENCWIGSNVTILGGVEVGAGCVVGAGSVVTKDLPAGSVAAGVPCRILRMRDGYE